MRTLIYKRTHRGDPDAAGQFGIHDCMGQHRTWGFEAVIGVGGIGAEPASYGLAGKVNWIGIGPRTGQWHKRGPIITFDHFLLFESDGPSFHELAPQLAARMYSEDRCNPMVDSLDPGEGGEVAKILALAKDAPPSSADGTRRVTTSEICVRPTACREQPAGEKRICSSGRSRTTS